MSESKMPQRCPQLRKLGSWSSEINFASPTTSEEIWEISAPSKNSLSWSIVLSYVISIKKENLKQQLELLLGKEDEMKEVMEKKKISADTINLQEVRNQVMRFNPFKNRHAFYFNGLMINVFRIFDLRLNRQANKTKVQKFEAASRMLKCQIRVFETDKDGNKKLHNFPNEPNVPCGNGQIVIFQYSGIALTTNINDVYAFGMSTDHALPLQKEALRYIMKIAKLSVTDIDNTLEHFQYKGNFLHFLLKTSKHHVIETLFKSPYIPLILQNTGFNVDPCCPGPEGLSAFYYCMGFSQTNMLRILYNYASNDFLETHMITRNPESRFLTAVQNIGKAIKNDWCQSKGFITLENEEKTLIAKKRCPQILKFNEFQFDVLKEMYAILGGNGVKIEPEHRRKFLMSLLRNYLNYFTFQSSNIVDKEEMLKEYIEFRDYYENVDTYTCHLFFDHFLRSRGPADSSFTTDVIFSLFLTVLGYKHFSINRSENIYRTNPVHDIQINSLQIFFLNARLKLKCACTELLRELDNDLNLKEPEAKGMISNITKHLSDIRAIRNIFLFYRLRSYLKTATYVPLDSSATKGVLSIERALQVLGETLTKSSGENSEIIFLLSSCLPSNLLSELFNMRNHCLSKYRTTIHGRLQLEDEIPRFKNYQNEIKCIIKLLEPVNITQMLQFETFTINRCLEDAENYSKDIRKEIDIHCSVIKSWKLYMYKTFQSDYQILAYNLLAYIHNCVEGNKVKNTSDLRDEIRALKYFFQSYADLLPEHQQLLDTLAVVENEMNANGQQEFKDDLKHSFIQNITTLRNLLDRIFTDSEPVASAFKFPHLCSQYQDIRRATWFSDEELQMMKDEIARVTDIKETIGVLTSLKESFDKGTPPSPQDIELKLSDTILTEKQRKQIMTDRGSKSFTTTKNILSRLIQEYSKYPFSNLEELVKYIEIDSNKNLLLKINFSSNLSEKVVKFLNRKIECLLDRIAKIKSILIEEDEEICILWKWGSFDEVQKHARFLMTQRFIKESDFRASLEMLLFDCHNILLERDDLKDLLTKTNNMFSGVSLRDVLSHGNTILETIGGYLDPEDLPNEFIDKMLELITDGEAIESIITLNEKLNIADIKQLSDAIKLDDGKDAFMKKKIKSSRHWEYYLDLFTFKY